MKNYSLFIILFAFVLVNQSQAAQQQPGFKAPPIDTSSGPPSSDLWLYQIDQIMPPIIKPIKRITQRPGYDNQPMFRPDNQGIYFTRFEQGQTDIYYYSISDDAISRVRKTSQSEYSPTPFAEGQLSVIQVNAAGEQHLVSLSISGEQTDRKLLTLNPVGYHSWLNEDLLALFVLGEPNTLQLVERQPQRSFILADDIGRSLQKVPEQDAISFIDSNGVIIQYNYRSGVRTTLAKTVRGSEDFSWLGSDTLLMGAKNKLYWRKVTSDNSEWKLVAGLLDPNRPNTILGRISRLAVSANLQYLVLVGDQ